MSVCLQMGHVPRTRGATGAPGEQAYNRAVCAETAPQLRSAGQPTVIIGADDRVPRTGVFVAVHYDGSNSPSARGASVGYRPGRATTAASRALAHLWKAAYQMLGFAGGFRGDNYTSGLSGYYGTGRAHAAGTPRAFILEGGFGSHPREGPWLRSRAGIAMCARAIVAAITGRNPGTTPPPEPEPDEPDQEDDTMYYDEGRTKPSRRVMDWQHALNLFMLLTGGWGSWGAPLKVDGHLGPKTAEAGWHAFARVRERLKSEKEDGSDFPRSLYLDHRNPSPTAVTYVVSENVRALAARKAKAA